MLDMITGALGGLLGGGGGGLGGLIPGSEPAGPAAKADASSNAGFGMNTPTLNQNFGSGMQYNKTAPVGTPESRGGTATATASASQPGSGYQTALTGEGPGGIPWPVIIIGIVALAAVIFGGRK